MVGNLHQCPADAIGIAGELYRRCVGKKFSLAAHRGLDQVAEKGAYESYDNQADGEKDNAPGVFGAAAEHTSPQQAITDETQHHDAVEHADQADIGTGEGLGHAVAVGNQRKAGFGDRLTRYI